MPHERYDFWTYVDKTETCWLWMGGRRGPGYGSYRGRYTHRVSWELHYGDIPSGGCVLHHCDVRLCVRPDHLYVGTKGDNILDCVRRGRHAQAKLNPECVRSIRSKRAAGIARDRIAAEYGVTGALVGMIARRKVWAWVE